MSETNHVPGRCGFTGCRHCAETYDAPRAETPTTFDVAGEALIATAVGEPSTFTIAIPAEPATLSDRTFGAAIAGARLDPPVSTPIEPARLVPVSVDLEVDDPDFEAGYWAGFRAGAEQAIADLAEGSGGDGLEVPEALAEALAEADEHLSEAVGRAVKIRGVRVGFREG